MKTPFLVIAALAMALAGCADIQTTSVYSRYSRGMTQPTIDQRVDVAAKTCDSKYEAKKQNFLSAAQTKLASSPIPLNPNRAPLERFRAEVDAAYNNVVSRCKAHINCLEVKFYDEAACYMSANDYNNAERDFKELAIRLREIERDYDAEVQRLKAKKKCNNCNKPAPNITVSPYIDVHPSQSQSNDQENNQQVGDNTDVEDMDVLVLCGDASKLLRKPCRQPCGRERC